MKLKPYVIKLKFGTWQNELWFEGDDSELSQARFNAASERIPEIAETCTNPNDFFLKTVELYAEYRFPRIQK